MVKGIRVPAGYLPGLQYDLARTNMVAGVAVAQQPLSGIKGENKKQREKNYIPDGG